jgi:hypothetical protein
MTASGVDGLYRSKTKGALLSGLIAGLSSLTLLTEAGPSNCQLPVF